MALASGLQNVGNTCGINTFIQCIGHTPKLKNIIKNLDCTNSKLANEFQAVLNIVWQESEDNSKYTCIPKGLVHEIYVSFKDILIPYHQHDLCEIFVLIIDKIASDTGIDKGISGGSGAKREGPNIIINKIVDNFNNNKISKLLKCVQGIQLSILNCESCGYQQINPEVFITLMLDIPRKKETISFNDVLVKYFEKESIPEWKCDKCKKIGTAQKIMQLWKAPEVIIIVLKRFDSDLNKINTPVDIPNNITFKKGSILRDTETEYSYKLMAVGNHTGSYNGGHYYALCKNKDSWYLYNDNFVSKTSDFDIQDAYILFYQKN